MVTRINWPLEDVWEKVQPLWPDFSVEYIHQTDSTSTQLLNRLRSGQVAPMMLVAGAQTAARGRMGKTWTSEPGDALTFSLAAPAPSLDKGGLSLVIACALIQALHKSTLPAQQRLKIKWPNDVWFMQTDQEGNPTWHKVAGILVETLTHAHQRFAVIGIGINIHPPSKPQGYSIPVGGLEQLTPHWDVAKAFACIAPEVAQAVYNFNNHGLEPWIEFFKQHDLLFDTPLYTSTGLQGVGAGINPQGHLLVQTESGVQTIHSGEVSVRPC